MVKAFTVLALCLVAGCVTQQRGPTFATYPVTDSVRILLTDEARAEIDRLAELTRRTRREQAACLADFAVLPTALHRSVVALIETGPANSYDSDSLMVWTKDRKSFCPTGVPNIHTHIVPNEAWGRPSDFDVQAAKDWPDVPFRVVVSVPAKGPPKVTVYAIR